MMAVENIPTLFSKDRIPFAALDRKRHRNSPCADDNDNSVLYSMGQATEFATTPTKRIKRTFVGGECLQGHVENQHISLSSTRRFVSLSRKNQSHSEKHDHVTNGVSSQDCREAGTSKMLSTSLLVSSGEQPLSLKSILLRKQKPKAPSRPRLLAGSHYSKYRALCWMDEEYTKPVVKRSRRVTWLNEQEGGTESPVAHEYLIPAIAPAGSFRKRVLRKRMQHRDEWKPSNYATTTELNHDPAVIVSEEEEEEDVDDGRRDCKVDQEDDHSSWLDIARDWDP